MQSRTQTSSSLAPRSALDRLVALFDLGIDPASLPADEMRRIRILGIATASMVVAGGGYGIRYGQLGLYDMQAAVVSTIVAAIVNLLVLRVTRRPVLAAHVALGLLTAMCVLSVFATGGFYDTNFAWLYLVPICAATVLDVRGAAAWTAVVVVLSVFFWSLPELGVVLSSRIPPESRSSMALFSRLTAICAAGLVGAAFVKGQRRAEQELAVANADLFNETAYVHLLMHGAVSANEAVSLESAMQDAVDRICHTMGWEVGHVCLVSEEGPLVSSGFFYTTDRERFGALCDYTISTVHWPGQALPGRALQSGRPQCIADIALAEGLGARASMALEVGLRSAFAVPVRVHGEVRAVLEFASTAVATGTARLAEVFALIGTQLGRVAERTTLQDRLRQSQKMEAVGQLAAGLAHEINNPMSYVRSNLHQLRQEWDALRAKLEGAGQWEESEDFEALIDESLEGVDRTIAIVKDVREFSHFGGHAGLGLEPVDLAELVDGALRVASPRSKPGVEFERAYADVPRVRCNPNQLRQVLVNLIVNAVQAVGDEGRVRLETGSDAAEAFVRIEDNGIGMSAETRERLFDPFFTTKPVGEGTGLGLYVSYEIVQNHGGRILVHSEPDIGSSFEVRLPLASVDVGPAPA